MSFDPQSKKYSGYVREKDLMVRIKDDEPVKLWFTFMGKEYEFERVKEKPKEETE